MWCRALVGGNRRARSREHASERRAVGYIAGGIILLGVAGYIQGTAKSERLQSRLQHFVGLSYITDISAGMRSIASCVPNGELGIWRCRYWHNKVVRLRPAKSAAQNRRSLSNFELLTLAFTRPPPNPALCESRSPGFSILLQSLSSNSLGIIPRLVTLIVLFSQIWFRP